MKQRAIFRKQFASLVPDNDVARDFLKTMKHGDVCFVDASRPRSLAHHRKYWAMINLVFDNQEHYTSAYEVHTAIKFGIGHTKKIKTPRGMFEIPLDTDFGAMDQVQFLDYWNRAVDYVAQKIIPGINKASFEAEVMELLGEAA